MSNTALIALLDAQAQQIAALRAALTAPAPDVASARTPEQAAFLAKRVRLAKCEIARDIFEGRVPALVGSFSDLHNHVDANEYGDTCTDTGAANWNAMFPTPGHADPQTPNENVIAVTDEMQREVDTWLRDNLRAATDIAGVTLMAAVSRVRAHLGKRSEFFANEYFGPQSDADVPVITAVALYLYGEFFETHRDEFGL